MSPAYIGGILAACIATSQAFFLPSSSQSTASSFCSIRPREYLTKLCSSRQQQPFQISTFLPNQIRIQRYLGEQRLTIEEEIEPRDGTRGPYGKRRPGSEKFTPTSREYKSLGTGVRLFEASLSGSGERVLLKEFFPVMKDIASAEMEVYRYIYQWIAQAEPEWLLEDLPVLPLLGFLETGSEVEDESFAYDWRTRFQNLPSPRAGNTWLVMAGYPLISLNGVPRLAGPPVAQGLLGVFFKDQGWEKRIQYIKAIMRQTIDCLGILHTAGIVHGSISSSTILVSTPDISRANDVIVRLGDMGFSKNALTQADFPSLVRRDLRQASYSLLELMLRLLDNPEALPDSKETAAGGVISAFTQVAAGELQVVTETKFNGDVGIGLRSLLSQDPTFRRAVACLDAEGGAGWVLFNDMANLVKFQDRLGNDPYAWANTFLASPFLR